MSKQASLPIDELLPAILRSLQEGARRLVVEAAPGAGKTTRLPPALLGQTWRTGPILTTEPRRIAARLAAVRVAQERNVPLGSEVGYRVRFEDKTSRTTELCYLTEGMLRTALLDDPGLRRTGVVVLDEVHERTVDMDVLLALLLHAQKLNPDLRLIAMSATLNRKELSAYLEADACFESQGRAFPVEDDFAPRKEERPLPIAVRSALRSRVKTRGSVLVFLPGEAEIRACQQALEGISNWHVQPLYGSLPLEKQVEVVRPSQTTSPRVILSTNVAESSLTVPGVTTVIDSGLARLGVFDPWTGIQRLETVEISQARCTQRAGRAGRLENGQAIRLYTRGELEARPTEETPELLRSDLGALLLWLLLYEERASIATRELRWLTPPEEAKWQRARENLVHLGACRSDGSLTEVGRLMAQLPLSPRLARCAIHAAQSGIAEQGALATALLSERDILQERARSESDVTAGDSDLEERMDLFQQLTDTGFDRHFARAHQLDVRRARQVERIRSSNLKALLRLTSPLESARPSTRVPAKDALLKSLLRGFWDRVAARKGRANLVLYDGTVARLSDTSCVQNAPLLLALSADAPGGRTRHPVVRMAARLDPDWLLDEQPDRIDAVDELVFNEDKLRVESVSLLKYGKLTLDESRLVPSPGPQVAEVLAQAALAKGPAVFDPAQKLETLARRLALLSELAPEFLATLDEDERALLEGAKETPAKLGEKALRQAALTRTTIKELKQADLPSELSGAFSRQLSKALREQVPETVRLLGGRVLPIHYEEGKSPFVQSRLQDFFSMNETPTICFGKLPLLIHFLAPNQRPIQVTSDLPGFWQRHYPDLRKQLMRRYPKHLWPEDGSTARPPTPGRIR